jgi:MFS family permease
VRADPGSRDRSRAKGLDASRASTENARAAGCTAQAQGESLKPAVSKKVVVAAVLGNALEFYDFAAYAFFAVYIGQAFFPASTPFASLLLSLAAFGVGYVLRPLGGAVIGAFADRAGRRQAMLLTIVLITAGTMGLALTPSYQSIGMAAPVIVVLCRLVQGFAIGGEVGPASAFLIEIAPANRRGLYGSWQLASQGLAALAAGAMGLALSLALDKADLAAWGWRVPFVLSLLLVPVGLYLRRAMPETLERPAPTEAAPWGVALGGQVRLLVLAILIILGGTVSTYVGVYMTTYAIATLHLPPSIALAATVVGGLATAVFAVLGGWLSDLYGRRSIMLAPRLLTAVATVPSFLLLNAWPSTATLWLATVSLTALTAMSGAATLTAVPELLPPSVRAGGFGIAYGLGASLFGGTTQLVVTWLIGATGDPNAPAWYVTATTLVSIAAIVALPKQHGGATAGRAAGGCGPTPSERRPI